jgi:hypothetical protein
MGCEASIACQPHKRANHLVMRIQQQKKLYNGLCFGSKNLQVYLPTNQPP